MSAESLVSAGGGRRLATVETDQLATAQGVGELIERMSDVCAAAIDPLEIVAALEFDGLGDQAARQRYGFADVFALAEEAYRRTRREPPEPEPAEDPYRPRVGRAAMHGVLYGLPAVCFPAATGLLAGPDALAVLIVSSLMSWSLGQGLAYLGYVRLGRAGRASAKAALRAGLAAGMGLVLAAMAVTWLVTGARLTTLAFGAGQGAYMLGASVLMVLGVERLLAVVLAPGVLAGGVFLILGRPAALEFPVWCALGLIPLLALSLAALHTLKAARGERPFTIRDLRDALPSGGFGLLAAALLAFPIAAGAVSGRIDTGALLAALPLSLSMGVAEWTLYWYRRRTRNLLHGVGTPAVFAHGARVALAGALCWYLYGAAMLTAIVAATAFTVRLVEPRPGLVPEVIAYLALGGAMYLSLLLQTFGDRLLPLAGCAAALAVEFGLFHWGVIGQVVACGALLLGLGCYATVVLGEVVRHAY